MRFLIDRCVGKTLADWLRSEGHDVLESRELGPDPGDMALLEHANREQRILVTIDTDFGQLMFRKNLPHCGLLRLPDVPARQRVQITADVLRRFSAQLTDRAIITVRGGRVRISGTVDRS